jgi:hypothetical protein
LLVDVGGLAIPIMINQLDPVMLWLGGKVSRTTSAMPKTLVD